LDLPVYHGRLDPQVGPDVEGLAAGGECVPRLIDQSFCISASAAFSSATDRSNDSTSRSRSAEIVAADGIRPVQREPDPLKEAVPRFREPTGRRSRFVA